MNAKEIIEMHNKICEYASANRILDAFSQIDYYLKKYPNEELLSELNNSVKIYENILLYTIKGIKDPKREQVLNSLILTIFDLADKLKEILFEKHNYHFYSHKISIFNKFQSIQGKFLKYANNQTSVSDKENNKWNENFFKEEIGEDKNNFFSLVFEYLIYREKLSDRDVDFIILLKENFKHEWYNLSILVSGLTLSIIRSFDVSKLDLLLKMYEDSNIQIKQRALVGLLISFIFYDNRIKFNSLLEKKLKKIYSESLISDLDVMVVIIQFLKAKQTEDITRKMREEIIPELRKLKPKIEENLDLKNILSEDISQDKHPDWQKMLEETPDLLNKIEDLSKMQVEGNDVFMSTFSMLKHFPFFKKTSNWFMPFYKENPEIFEEFPDENDKTFVQTISNLLEESSYMCNSDKYSFLFNLNMMPAQQREILVDMYKAELEGMSDLSKEDELLNAAVKNSVIVTQYIQDLYRFFKLHPEKDMFGDIFSIKFNVYKMYFFRMLFNDTDIIMKMADFYFSTEKYKEALEVFHEILSSGVHTQELLQKTAYCYQKTGDYETALQYYLRAELYDTPHPWLLKKIGLCYFNLRNFEKALIYYLDAEKLEPENSQLCMSIANCYLNLKDYKNALNYYYKIEVLFKENQKIYRPIAWCLFVSKNFTKAEEYLKKILDSDAVSSFDYLIYGHIQWIKGEMLMAAEAYIKSVEKSKNKFSEFVERMKDDFEFLAENGVAKKDFQFMIDYVRMQTDLLK